MSGRGEDRRAVTLLHRTAVQHHHDPVAHGAHDGEVVADEKQGQIQIQPQLAQQCKDLRLARDIEPRDDLVGYHQSRLQCDGPRDADALALAARELMGVARAMGRAQYHPLQQGVHLFARLGARAHPAVKAQRLGDDVGHPVPRIERGLRVLEDHLELGPQRAEPLLGQVRDVLAVEPEAAGGGGVEADQGPPQAGLAGAALADDSQGIAGRQRKIDAAQDVDHGRGAEGRLAAEVGQGQAQPGRLQEHGLSHRSAALHRRPAPPRAAVPPAPRARAAAARRGGRDAASRP